MHALNASTAAIIRSIGAERPTLLIDEVDAIFTYRGKDESHEDLRALLNAGHRKGASIPRCVGQSQEVRRFPVFCAVALAGLGDLPDTLMTRSLVLRMKRRRPDEPVRPFRRREAEPVLTALAARLAAAMGEHAERLSGAWPDLPEGVTDRPADVWEPLLAIADAAGGEWPKRARAACGELVAAARSVDSGSLGLRLLRDLRTVFGLDNTDSADSGQGAAPKEKMSSADIVAALIGLPEAPWGGPQGKAARSAWSRSPTPFLQRPPQEGRGLMGLPGRRPA